MYTYKVIYRLDGQNYKDDGQNKTIELKAHQNSGILFDIAKMIKSNSDYVPIQVINTQTGWKYDYELNQEMN